MDNNYLKAYDVVRFHKQENPLIEIITWVKKKKKRAFPDYKRLYSFMIFEDQL